jgi:hypothetical protein
MLGKKTDKQAAATPTGATASAPPSGRIRQIGQAYKLTKRHDKRIGWLLLGVFVAVAGVLGFAGFVFLGPWIGVPLALVIALMVTMLVFGRRVERAAYAQVEGQPGAAAAGLQMLRRGWNVKPGVAFTKNQDVVHRVVGRPGIVLVGEGNPARVRNLLVVERRKHARVAGEAPITEIVAGDDVGEVPVRKLAKHVQKLPKKISPGDMTDLLARLRALDAMRPQAPIPRGPVPTSAKGMRRMMQGR